MVGKWHLCPDDEMNLASTRRNWPSGPRLRALVRVPRRGDEPVVSRPRLRQPPRRPAEVARGGLPPDRRPHRQGDRVHPRREGRSRRRSRSSSTTRPARATRRTTRPKEWIDRYKGQFDMGYEAMREQTLARQKELGIVPKDTELPPINPIGTPETRTGPDGKPFPALDVTRPWDSLSAEEKTLFCRMAEVYAGFLAHADDQIGRLLDFLEEFGWRENTLVILVSDNGASRRGRPERLGQRDEVRERHPRRRSRRTSRCSTSSAARRRTTTTRTAGRWRSTRRSRCGSATSSTAARATRASSRGRPG